MVHSKKILFEPTYDKARHYKIINENENKYFFPSFSASSALPEFSDEFFSSLLHIQQTGFILVCMCVCLFHVCSKKGDIVAVAVAVTTYEHDNNTFEIFSKLWKWIILLLLFRFFACLFFFTLLYRLSFSLHSEFTRSTPRHKNEWHKEWTHTNNNEINIGLDSRIVRVPFHFVCYLFCWVFRAKERKNTEKWKKERHHLHYW